MAAATVAQRIDGLDQRANGDNPASRATMGGMSAGSASPTSSRP